MEPHEFDAMLTSVNNMSRWSNRLSSKVDTQRQQIKLAFELQVRSVQLAEAQDGTEFSICWVRGSQNINTKSHRAAGG